MPSITIRVSPALHESLTSKCEERGIPLSDLVRELLDRVDDAMADRHSIAGKSGNWESHALGSAMVAHSPEVKRLDSRSFKPVNWDGSPVEKRKPYQKGAKKP